MTQVEKEKSDLRMKKRTTSLLNESDDEMTGFTEKEQAKKHKEDVYLPHNKPSTAINNIPKKGQMQLWYFVRTFSENQTETITIGKH